MTQPTPAPEADILPPFDPAAASSARSLMAFTPERVAATLASYGVNVLPNDVRAWEKGTRSPSEDELIGLAQALAVPVDRLMGPAAATLQAFRLRNGMTRTEIGRKVGMSEASWTRMERANCWRADDRRTAALVRTLGSLSHRQLVELAGAGDDLDALVARALADGRWRAYVSDITELLGARRHKVAEALEALAADFPPGTEKLDDDAAPPLPDGAVDRLWQHLGDPPADPYAPGVWLRPVRKP